MIKVLYTPSLVILILRIYHPRQRLNPSLSLPVPTAACAKVTTILRTCLSRFFSSHVLHRFDCLFCPKQSLSEFNL